MNFVISRTPLPDATHCSNDCIYVAVLRRSSLVRRLPLVAPASLRVACLVDINNGPQSGGVLHQLTLAPLHRLLAHRMPGMRHIDADLINTDLQARVDYLTKFIEFGPADAEALHNAAPIVKPLAGAAVDAVCECNLGSKYFHAN